MPGAVALIRQPVEFQLLVASLVTDIVTGIVAPGATAMLEPPPSESESTDKAANALLPMEKPTANNNQLATRRSAAVKASLGEVWRWEGSLVANMVTSLPCFVVANCIMELCSC